MDQYWLTIWCQIDSIEFYLNQPLTYFYVSAYLGKLKMCTLE